VRIKVCGFTQEDEARAAIDLGVDALGFNFFPGSRRALSWPQAGEWISRLPAGACRVALLVQPSPEEVLSFAQAGIFDLLQFHGGEPPSLCEVSSLPWIRAAPAGDAQWSLYASGCWLVDASAAKGEYGGTGRLADWEAAASLVRHHPGQAIFLAGGLHPGNVGEAVARVRPSGVDVAGGVESAPGRKDVEQMRALVAAVRKVSES
jgi:phosphoribosylanthranilate isomerase